MFKDTIEPFIEASSPFLGPILVSLGSIFVIYFILKMKTKKKQTKREKYLEKIDDLKNK